MIEAGATWFWPNEPLTAALAERLGQTSYYQHVDGDALWEGQPPQRRRLDGNPLGMSALRVTAGAQQLAESLAHALPSGSLHLASPVTAVTVGTDSVQVQTRTTSARAAQVVLALPPALAVEHLDFQPALPHRLQEIARRTSVWMGDMVKAVATYAEPFWRDQGLSGSAMSHRGPFRELHDHCGRDGRPAALFGFAPAAQLTGASAEQVGVQFVDQLVRLFGPQAGNATQVQVLDWSREQYTQPVRSSAGSSAFFGAAEYQQPVHGRLHWASTETAAAFAGHMEGAIRAGLAAAEAVLHSR